MDQNRLKTDVLYRDLKRELSRLAPGERFFSVRDLMREHGVSQPVVTRVMERLAAEARLEVIPRKGCFVPQTSVEPQAPPTYMVAVPNWISPDIDEIQAALHELQPEYSGIRLLLYRFDFRHAIPPELALRTENVRGMLLMPGRVNTLTEGDVAAFNVFRRHGPLVVLCHHLANFNVPSVGLDDMFAGNCAAHHLCNAGHRKIGVLVSEPENSVINDRVAGILNYASLHEMETVLINCGILSGEAPQEKTYRKFEQVIREGFDFTAIAGVSSDSVAGALNACHNYGIAIPQRLGVVVIGNASSSATLYPPLDTVAVGLLNQIRVALEMLRSGELGNKDIQPVLIDHGSSRGVI